jgi:hypothetical protein
LYSSQHAPSVPEVEYVISRRLRARPRHGSVGYNQLENKSEG